MVFSLAFKEKKTRGRYSFRLFEEIAALHLFYRRVECFFPLRKGVFLL